MMTPIILFVLAISLMSHANGFLPSAMAQQPFKTQSSTSPITNQGLLDKAKRFFEMQQLKDTLTTLEELLERDPPPPILQEAYFLQAITYRMHNQEREAAATLEQLLEEFPVSSLANEARLVLGELYQSLHEYQRAITVLQAVVTLTTNSATRLEALHRLRDVYIMLGEFLPAIQRALEELPLTGQAGRAEIKAVIQELILQKMNEPSLETLVEHYPSRYPGDLAIIRLIELHTAHSDEVLAERDIRSFVQQFPDHPYAQTAMALLQSFVSKIKANQFVLTAILPFSGPMKPFGTDALNGVRLALEDGKTQLGLSSIGLVVKDTTSPATSLQHAIELMIDEFHPLAAIGPLSSREIQSLRYLPEEYDIPFLTPSATLLNVRQFGSFWFSTAMTAALQMKALVQYAISHLGFTRFCILHPQTAYGEEMNRVFIQAVKKNGGEIIAVEAYSEKASDFGLQIRHLKEKDVQRYGSFKTVKTRTGHQHTMYTPGFDAVFIPGQPIHAALLAAQLKFYDIKVPLLGSNSWHSPILLKWAKHEVEGAFLTDGFFLENPDSSLHAFADRYQARFHKDPSIFSAQAYDAAWLILDAIRKGSQTGQEIRDQFFRRHDLPFLNGLGAFGSDGVLDRKISIIQVKQGKFEEVQ